MRVSKTIILFLMIAFIIITLVILATCTQKKDGFISQIIIFKGDASDTGIGISTFKLMEGEEMTVTAKGVDKDGNDVPIWPTWKADKELSISVEEGRSKTVVVEALKEAAQVSFSAIYVTDEGKKVTKVVTGEIKRKLSFTPTSTKEPKTTPAMTWHEIVRWQGKSIKETETFHIPSREWRILWSTKPGEYGDMNFSIIVYSSDGTMVNVAANTIGEGSDISYVRGSGDYYLSINTAQLYIIVIEAKY
jgi:hypothetical protein